MGITDRFCPKCGQPTDREGLCNRCRAGGLQWLSCDNRVESVHCPACGSLKQAGSWSDTTRERAEIADELVRAAVHVHHDVKSPDVKIRIRDLSQNRSRAHVTVTGNLYGQQVEGACEITLAWIKEQCDRCNRISGSYYEGVVQVRAAGRRPSAYEIKVASMIAEDAEESLQTGGERLSFISDVTETKDGLDIVVGSQHIGLLLAQKITAELGGRYTTHPKLVGEKAGRQLFRITYSVRLPRFQKNDIVRLAGRYAEVLQVEPHGLRVLDFSNGMVRSVREGDVERRIGNSRDARDALVAYTDRDMAGIIDPVSAKTVEYRKGKNEILEAGCHVRVLHDGDRLVVVR